MEVWNVEEMHQYLEDVPPYYKYPPIIMILVTSRLVIFSIVNVWFVVMIISIYVEENNEVERKKRSAVRRKILFIE